jgi:hypothetical protein
MPNIYIKDETKELLEKVSAADCRGQDGEINYLLKQRFIELDLRDMNLPSMNPNVTQSGCTCQGENNQ